MSFSSRPPKPVRDRIRRAVYERDGYTCVFCDFRPEGDPFVVDQSVNHLTLDHIVPASRGGRFTKDNLQTAC